MKASVVEKEERVSGRGVEKKVSETDCDRDYVTKRGEESERKNK